MSEPRDLYWIASTYKDLLGFPDEVQDVMGFALYRAQIGEKHEKAKVLKGFGGQRCLRLSKTAWETPIGESIP